MAMAGRSPFGAFVGAQRAGQAAYGGLVENALAQAIRRQQEARLQAQSDRTYNLQLAGDARMARKDLVDRFATIDNDVYPAEAWLQEAEAAQATFGPELGLNLDWFRQRLGSSPPPESLPASPSAAGAAPDSTHVASGFGSTAAQLAASERMLKLRSAGADLSGGTQIDTQAQESLARSIGTGAYPLKRLAFKAARKAEGLADDVVEDTLSKFDKFHGDAVQQANADREWDHKLKVADSWKSGFGMSLLRQGGGDPRPQKSILRDPDGTSGPLPAKWVAAQDLPGTQYQVARDLGLLNEGILAAASNEENRSRPSEAVAETIYQSFEDFNPDLVQKIAQAIPGYEVGKGYVGEQMVPGDMNLLSGIAASISAPLANKLRGTKTIPGGDPISLEDRIKAFPELEQAITSINDGTYTPYDVKRAIYKLANDFQMPLRDVKTLDRLLSAPAAAAGSAPAPVKLSGEDAVRAALGR